MRFSVHPTFFKIFIKFDFFNPNPNPKQQIYMIFITVNEQENYTESKIQIQSSETPVTVENCQYA